MKLKCYCCKKEIVLGLQEKEDFLLHQASNEEEDRFMCDDCYEIMMGDDEE